MTVTFSDSAVKETHEVVISELIASDVAMTPAEGDLVREEIERILSEHQGQRLRIVLSFSELSVVTSAFLNTAVGELYGKHDWDSLARVLSVAKAPDRYHELLRRVVKTAKNYYSNREGFRSSVDQVVDDDE